MPIIVACQSCKSKFKAPDKAAGKTKKCPQCKSPIEIPELPRPITPEVEKSVTTKPNSESTKPPISNGFTTKPTDVKMNSGSVEPTMQSNLKQKMSLEEALGPLLSPLIPIFRRNPRRFVFLTTAAVLGTILVIYNLSQLNWGDSSHKTNANNSGSPSQGTTKKDAEELLLVFLEFWKRDDIDGFKRKFPGIENFYSTNLRIDGYSILDGWEGKVGNSYQFVVRLSYRHGGGDKVHISVSFYSGKATIGYGR